MSQNMVEVVGVSSSRQIEPLKVEPLKDFFNSLLPYQDTFLFASILSSRADLVLNRIIPSYKYKLGKGLVEQAKVRTRKVVNDAIQIGQPIPLVANIGTSKWFDGTHTDENIAGLSELLMLEQMLLVDKRVREVYEQGVRWTLLAEDTTNQWLYSLINTPEAIAVNNTVYLATLERMVKQVMKSSSLNVHLIRESELFPINGKSKRDYLYLLNHNKTLFQEYFEATLPLEAKLLLHDQGNNLSQEQWEKHVACFFPSISAYKALCDNGWNSGVHPIQRMHYETQFEKSGGDAAKTPEYLAAYFGSVLARRQMQFASISSGEPSIKVAFLRYPNGTNESEMSALTISQHPLYGHGASHKRISPWAAETNVEINAKKQISLKVRHAMNTELPYLDQYIVTYSGTSVPVKLIDADNL